jgi:DNA-binding transcriptional ArsR family regulator
MPGQDFFVVPESTLTIAPEPALNVFHSMLLLARDPHLSGISNWVTQTVDQLSPEARTQHKLVIIGFYYAFMPEKSWPSFPAYLDHLVTYDPVEMRDKMLTTYARFPLLIDGQPQALYDQPAPVDWEAVLKDVDSYLSFLRERFPKFDEELEAAAYTYVIDPPAMQDLIITHLQAMWDQYLSAEWERVEPMIQDSIEAFQQFDLSTMSRLEAAQFITGQEMDLEKWQSVMEDFARVVFIPSPHVGPYLGKLWSDDTLWVFFGARLPEGSQFHAPDLSRAELLVRLSALSDDNRLRILKLVSEEGELSSRDIMTRLDMSQSAASRHLKQLSATGYLTERRCNGAKCYTLNPDRVRDTLNAVSVFLLKS